MYSSNSVKHILSTRTSANNTLVAYHYCDFRQRQGTDMICVLGSLVSQFCRSTSSCSNSLRVAHSDSLEAGKTSKPKLATLRDAILEFSKDYHLTLMVDGLDECDQPIDLAGFLQELFMVGGSISVLVTGRGDIYLQEILGDWDQVKLQAHMSDMSADIELYIHFRIQRDRRLSRLNPTIQREIRESLYSKSAGMFRWVQCQLDSMSAMRTPKAIREALQSLPQGLEETYSRILRNVPSADAHVVLRTLQWVTLSVTPLSLAQVSEAVAVEHGDLEIDDENRLISPDDILALCGSLVVRNELETLKLAHLSVEEYLFSNGIREDPTVATFAMTKVESSMSLLLDCITYLNFNEFRTGPSQSEADFKERMERFPLLPHAARSWPYYFRACASLEVARTEVSRFLSSKNQNAFLSWVQVLNARRIDQWDEWPRQATALYYASSFGLHSIVQALIQSGSVINAPASRFGGTALHGATLREHVNVMKVLLDAGADPDKPDFNLIAPLHTAVFWGNKEVVSILLRHGASPSLKGAHDESPLDWAGNDSRIKQMLLDSKDQSAPEDPTWTTAAELRQHFQGSRPGMSSFEALDIMSFQLGGESRTSLVRSTWKKKQLQDSMI